MKNPIRIIDIGSNSIKVLVATRSEANDAIVPLFEDTLETRISTGISAELPTLREEPMDNGVKAVKSLLESTQQWNPGTTRIVATSAVRDAVNREVFCERIRLETGHSLRVLSGIEEASYIAHGVATDTSLPANLCILDLGGGSLECIDAISGVVQLVESFQLGAVRMMERFQKDPALPLHVDESAAIADHVTQTLAARVPALQGKRVCCVGCGGTFAVIQAILADRAGQTLQSDSTEVHNAELVALHDQLGGLDINERMAIKGLPASRADIFPTALTVLTAVAAFLGTRSFIYSLRNLRYGIAAELLASQN